MSADLVVNSRYIGGHVRFHVQDVVYDSNIILIVDYRGANRKWADVSGRGEKNAVASVRWDKRNDVPPYDLRLFGLMLRFQVAFDLPAFFAEAPVVAVLFLGAGLAGGGR
jgi:hypothetical protein